jgi:hypothetical protein
MQEQIRMLNMPLIEFFIPKAPAPFIPSEFLERTGRKFVIQGDFNFNWFVISDFQAKCLNFIWLSGYPSCFLGKGPTHQLNRSMVWFLFFDSIH